MTDKESNLLVDAVEKWLLQVQDVSVRDTTQQFSYEPEEVGQDHVTSVDSYN